jgi:hypothetical protein
MSKLTPKDLVKLPFMVANEALEKMGIEKNAVTFGVFPKAAIVNIGRWHDDDLDCTDKDADFNGEATVICLAWGLEYQVPLHISEVVMLVHGCKLEDIDGVEKP